MTSMIHARLSSTLKNIGNHDVIIQVGKNNDVKEFAAHSSVLRACSSYFEKALPTLTAEKNSFFLLLKEPNINPTTFELIHNYIYTDKLDLTELFGYEVLSLLDVSDELNFKRLIHHVQVHLIKQQSDWIQRNIALVIHKAFKIANCKLLQDHCIEIICEDPSPFITSRDFLSLDKDILYVLLKRDDLQIEEIVLWDNLIEWGIKQTPVLKDDKTKWDDADYEALKKTLDKFIPLIRYSGINSADFFAKVHQYKPIFPHQLFYHHDLEKYKWNRRLSSQDLFLYLLTGLKKNDGDIGEKFEKDYLYGKKYEFKLLSHSYYRFKSDLFRDLCNIQKDILLLFRDSKTSKIYGGYRPYKSNDGGLSLFKDNCFIFCFENKENTRNMKMIRIFYNHLDDQMNFCYKDVNGKIVKITDFDSVESEVFEVERVVKGLDK
ncbi:16834_t:CDS:2 [Funneliformis geosporum]|uniref:16834_t:CDS:1 n=1 Tax=Funneliformis geosporum TaxID=1117311 RepID=A0A9W4WM30_9GLOM|nr:16834_t:CDS:2 [Funneliformis geosporum]